MGEPVSVIQKSSSNHGVIRLETNRTFTGMGHERYKASDVIVGDRPPDVAARALFATGQVDQVHVYAQTITVTLGQGADSDGLKEIVENLFIHYLPGVEVPDESSFD